MEEEYSIDAAQIEAARVMRDALETAEVYVGALPHGEANICLKKIRAAIAAAEAAGIKAGS
jgi:hypothetical protein